MRPTAEENAKENVRDDLAYQARAKDALKENDRIVGIIGRSVLVDIKITIKNIEYADELLDFLKKYHSLEGTSENLGVLSKKIFYSKNLNKGEHIGIFLATMHSDGQKLKISEDELIKYLFSKGTLPDTWKSFLDLRGSKACNARLCVSLDTSGLFIFTRKLAYKMTKLASVFNSFYIPLHVINAGNYLTIKKLKN